MTKQDVPQSAEDCNSLTNAEDAKFRALIQQAGAGGAGRAGRSDASIAAGLKTTVGELTRTLKGEPSPVNTRIREAITMGAIPPEPRAMPAPVAPATPADFAAFWARGYRRIVPVVPPGATPHPESALANRKGALGKAPGVKGDDGLWRGFPWLKHETTKADLSSWGNMGASVGLRTGAGLFALDVDTLDATLAGIVRQAASEILGPAKFREGRAPKFLLAYRCDELAPYACCKFRGKAGAEERVELLGEGRQFVAAGPHPSGVAYQWPEGVPSFDELTPVTLAQLQALFAKLAEILPEANLDRMFVQSGNPPDQKSLIGDPDTVRRAVEAMPNAGDRFATRAAYVQTGYMIKGATQDNEGLGLELFHDWCARWTEGENDPDTVEADWRRMQPPFHSGAPQLYRMAEEASGGRFSEASAYFSVIPPAPDWLIDPTRWEGAPLPPREWIVEGLIPQGTVTLLTGDGATGKSLLAMQLCAAMAIGGSWVGRAVKPGRALYFSAEDDGSELHRRLHAIVKANSTTFVAVGASLRLRDSVGVNAVLGGRASDGSIGPTGLFHELERQVAGWRSDLVVLDTLADVFNGDEINRAHARQFIALLKRLCRNCGCTALVLAHPSLSGMSSGAGTSGSTGWSNAVRSRLYFQVEKSRQGRERSDRRTLTVMKANYAAAGEPIVVRYAGGVFVPVDGAAEADSREYDNDELFLTLLRSRNAQNRHVSDKPGVNYAPKIFADDPAAEGVSKDRLTLAMARLVNASAIKVDETGPQSKRRRVIVEAEPQAKNPNIGPLEGVGKTAFQRHEINEL